MQNEQWFRALYEATACGTRHILEDASKHGLRVERVFVGGGGAKSPLWLQIHADVLDFPIHLTRETEGVGLGLPLARAMIGLHGGDLTLTSEVGVGTLVEVTLPADRLRITPAG